MAEASSALATNAPANAAALAPMEYRTNPVALREWVLVKMIRVKVNINNFFFMNISPLESITPSFPAIYGVIL